MSGGRLIYVAGPSGAGKDSLMGWVRRQLKSHHGAPLTHRPVFFAHRSITRPPAGPGDEQHESLDSATFDALRDAGAFAFDWRANGLHYGVRAIELAPLQAGHTVVVNGSRAYLGEAVRRCPGLVAVHVTAGIDTLRRRLSGRGRESAEDVEARLQRAAAFQLPEGVDAVEIRNETTLEAAGQELLAVLLDGGMRRANSS